MSIAVEKVEQVRLAIYRSFATTGRAPSIEALGNSLNISPDQVRLGVRTLADARHLFLGDDDEVILAHPFSSMPLGFAVMGARILWWGGCAWDSFALPHIVSDDEVLVSTKCPACSSPHAWNVNRYQAPEGDQVAHLLTPIAHMWDDVVHTCGNQRIFCSTQCVDSWLEENRLPRGYVMDLRQLWSLAAHWYDGRLEEGYVRRDPAGATQYFKGIGLSGSFWDL